MGPEPRLETQNLKVRQLVEDYRGGRLVIPEFQREYVWKPNRAPRLVDSLYRRFPISVLLLWASDVESPRARRREPRPSRANAVSWLIDGQQRVITLSRILSGDEGIDVVFNPNEDAFRSANAATSRDRNWVRVSELLDDESYRQIRRTLPEGDKGEKLEAKFDRVARLDYEIPAVRMVDYSFDDAVDAFTRINTLGVKLHTQDIESARVAARHSGFIADEVIPFMSELRREGFSRLNVMHLFRACAFIAVPDGRSRTPLHELSHNDVMDAWSRTGKRATKEAIALVRNQFGLVNMDILWSGALLVPVIALCESTPPRVTDKNPTLWRILPSSRAELTRRSERHRQTSI